VIRAALVAALLIWTGGGATPALSEEILLIYGDQPLYQQATDGVTDSFRADLGERVTRLPLNDLLSGAVSMGELPTPDVVIAVGAAATRAASQRYPERPIVFCMVIRPERIDLSPYAVGISMFVPIQDLIATLALISPNIRHLGVLHGPEHRAMIEEESARLTGFETRLIPVEINDDRDLPKLARKLVLQSDALWIVPGSLSGPEAYQFLLRLSTEHRVPLIGDSPALVKAGAFMSITPDPTDIGRQAGRLAGYLLSGEGLPPEPMFQPDMANLSLNLRTARAMNIEIPPLVRQFASIAVE